MFTKGFWGLSSNLECPETLWKLEGRNLTAVKGRVKIIRRPTMAKTHRSALELYEDGTTGATGLYLPTANLTDPDTSGQITYAEGTGIVTLSPIKIINTTDIGASILDINANQSAKTASAVKITQDHTTGAQVCLELDQDDTNVPILKITETTGSSLVNDIAYAVAGSAIADFAFAVTVGSSTYLVPLIDY